MIKSLQTWRLLFALVIFLHHFPVDGAGLFKAGGPLGVSFFMMLSGLVMSAGYERKVLSDDFSYGNFLLKRLLRLWPLHLLCLAVFVLLHLSSVFASWRSVGTLGLNALMLQSWVPVRSVYFSGNAVSWCLCDLMFCYALFPWLCRLLQRLPRKTIAFGVLSLLTLYFVVVALLPQPMVHPLVYISPLFRLLDFLWGMLLYRFSESCLARLRQEQKRWSCAWLSLAEMAAVALVALAAACYGSVPWGLRLAAWWWLPVAALLLVFRLSEGLGGGLLTRLLSCNGLVALSSCSFTFYMIHQLALGPLLAWSDHVGLVLPLPLMLGFSALLICLLALLLNRYFERPLSRIIP